MWAIGLCLIPVAGSVWLSLQCYADFLNLGIVVVLAIIWTLAGPLLLDTVKMSDLELLNNQAVLTVCLLSIYLYLHAIILSVANFIEKRRDESK